MGLRGPHAVRLTWLLPRSGPARPVPKPRPKHRFLCRECREPFIALRDDARFCSGGCKQANYRRRGALPAGKAEIAGSTV